MNHLRPKGRAGIIVPEGIIFQSGKAYKKLRKNLVNDGLCAVASLPSGVFNPYAGVKTSILFFDNEIAKKTNELLFVKISQDGFNLGAQRKQIEKNDLPEALEILKKWKTGEKVESILALYVKKSKIAEDDDYNLSGDRYRTEIDYSNVKWPIVKLSEVVIDMKDGGTPSRSKPEYFGGNICWAVVKDIKPEIYNTNEKITEDGLKNSSAKIWPIDSIIISLGATIGNVGITKVPIATKQGLSGIVVDRKKILPKFLYYILIGQKSFIQSQATGASIKEIRPSKLQKILMIPLPPLETQEEIIKELDGYQNIIIGAKQIIDNWRPKIDIDPEWKKVKLGKVIKLSSGRGLTQLNIIKGDYPVYGGNGVNGYHNDYFLEKSTLVIGRVGAYCGSIHITKPRSWVTDNGLYVVEYLKKNDIRYLAFILEALNINKFAKIGGQPSISQNTVYELEIPFPSFEIQKQIVKKIEEERMLVESSKELIVIYEQKVREIIDKLWGS